MTMQRRQILARSAAMAALLTPLAPAALAQATAPRPGAPAAKAARRFSADDQARARTALGKVRLDRLADRSYLELSGGERQLVLIARALAQNSDFLIMDEPASGLDYGNQFHLLQVIQELSLEGFSIVLTTHHPEQAVFLGGRAILLREGQVFAQGHKDAVLHSETLSAQYAAPIRVRRNGGYYHAELDGDCAAS